MNGVQLQIVQSTQALDPALLRHLEMDQSQVSTHTPLPLRLSYTLAMEQLIKQVACHEPTIIIHIASHQTLCSVIINKHTLHA